MLKCHPTFQRVHPYPRLLVCAYSSREDGGVPLSVVPGLFRSWGHNLCSQPLGWRWREEEGLPTTVIYSRQQAHA